MLCPEGHDTYVFPNQWTLRGQGHCQGHLLLLAGWEQLRLNTAKAGGKVCVLPGSTLTVFTKLGPAKQLQMTGPQDLEDSKPLSSPGPQ